MDERFRALAELAVRGVNVQPGQVVGISAVYGQHAFARALAEAAYARGARYVDVAFFDPHLKRARIEHADPETLAYVPPWLGGRLLSLGELGGARISLRGIVEPDVLDGLDPERVGRDLLPWLKEVSRTIEERSLNWSVVPCPHPGWAALVYPELDADAAYERLWAELWHIMRLDEPDPWAAWEERCAVLDESARLLNERSFAALELHGPGTDLHIGLLPGSVWGGGLATSARGIRHLPNIPTEEVFTTPDPARTSGTVAATRPLTLGDGLVVRGLRVRFVEGRAVEVSAEENGEALRVKTEIDEGAARLGEVALVDNRGRIGPLGTVFYDTLLDENAASHVAFGNGVRSARGRDGVERMNRSGVHIDFMIGSPELEVFGLTAGGDRVPVLAGGEWQL